MRRIYLVTESATKTAALHSAQHASFCECARRADALADQTLAGLIIVLLGRARGAARRGALIGNARQGRVPGARDVAA
jgi:hypothetical protein